MKPLVLTPSRTAAIPLTATSSTLERRISTRSASPLQSPPAAASPNHLYRSASSIRTYSSPPPTQAKRRSLGYYVSESKRSSNNSSASSSYVVNLAREYSRSSNATAESPDSSVVEFGGDGTTQWGSEELGSEYSHRDRDDERLETAFEAENELELEREIRSVVRVRQVSITPRILDYSHPRDDSSETIAPDSASPLSTESTTTLPPIIALSKPSPVRPISNSSERSTRSNQPTRPPFDRPKPNSANLSPGTTSAATLEGPLSVVSEPPSPPPSFPLPRLPPKTLPLSNRSSVDSHQKTSSIISTSSSQSSQEDFRLSTYSVDQFLDPDGHIASDSTSRRRARSSLVSIAPSIRRLDSWSGGLESAGVTAGAGVGTEHFNQHWHEDLLSTLDDVVPHPPSSTASILADYTFGAASKSAPPQSTSTSIAQKPLPTISTSVSPSSSSKELAATVAVPERVARPRKLSPTSLNTIRNSLFSSSPNLLRTAPSSPSVDEVDGFIREPRQREGSFVSLSPTKSRTMPLPRVGSISGAAGSPAKPSASWPPPDEPTRTITAGKQLVSMEQQSPSRATLKRDNSTTSSTYPGHYLAQSTRREPRDPRGKIDQDDMSLRDFFNTTLPTPVSPPRSISPLTTRSSYSNYSVDSVTPASKTRFGSKLFSGFAKTGGETTKNGLSRQTSLSSLTERFNLRRATNLNSFGADSKSPRMEDSDDVLEIIVPLGSPSTPPFVRIMSPRSPQSLSPSLSSTSISSLAPKVLPISSILPVRKSTVFPSRLTGSSVEGDRI